MAGEKYVLSYSVITAVDVGRTLIYSCLMISLTLNTKTYNEEVLSFDFSIIKQRTLKYDSMTNIIIVLVSHWLYMHNNIIH